VWILANRLATWARWKGTLMGDLLVRGGEVIDGRGAPPRRADLRVCAGRITEIGIDLKPEGERQIDAGGAFVTPGFIDGHTHVDPALWWDPGCDPLPSHGVTTVVTGNCSLSLAPLKKENRASLTDMFCFIEDLPNEAFEAGIPWSWETWPEYRRAFDARGAAVQVAPLVGHSALRLHVIGEESYERASTEAERKAIAALMRECLTAGAFGLSTSFLDTDRAGRPVPSRAADDDEFRALVGEMAAMGRGVFEFVPRLMQLETQMEDIERVHSLCRGAGVPATWTQLYIGDHNADHIEPLLAQATRTQLEGPGVFPQVSPRPFDVNLSFDQTAVFMAMPAWNEIVSVGADGKRQRLEDREWRKRARAEWDDGQPSLFPKDRPDRVVFSGVTRPELESFIGMNLADYAASREQHPSDALADWVLANDLSPQITLADTAYAPERVAELLSHPATVCAASDAGAHVQMMCGGGDTSLLLERYVRERADFPVEEAIRRMTSEVAMLFGIHDRGILEVGYAGDLAVFSLDEIRWAPETFVSDLPGGHSRITRPAGGIRATVVAGVPTHLDGQSTGATPGRMLEPRRGPKRAAASTSAGE
jgi:N-acyl-D-aspartate/D-glutamate deacylase